MTNDQIREIFLANGFEIKPGYDDLEPYVYAAARALLAQEQARTKEEEAYRLESRYAMYRSIWRPSTHHSEANT